MANFWQFLAKNGQFLNFFQKSASWNIFYVSKALSNCQVSEKSNERMSRYERDALTYAHTYIHTYKGQLIGLPAARPIIVHFGYLRLTESSTWDLEAQISLCDIRHNCSIICLLDYIDRSMGVASPSLLHAYSNDREVSIGLSTRFALRRHDTLVSTAWEYA